MALFVIVGLATRAAAAAAVQRARRVDGGVEPREINVVVPKGAVDTAQVLAIAGVLLLFLLYIRSLLCLASSYVWAYLSLPFRMI